MTPASRLCLALWAMITAAAGQAQSVQDFELPAGPVATPEPAPQVQGPVDPDAPLSTRPRLLPEPTAPPPSPAPPSETAAPRTAEPTARPASGDIIRRPINPAPNQRGAAAAPLSDSAPSQTAAPAPAGEPPLAGATPAAGPMPAPLATASPEQGAAPTLPALPWAWIVGAVAALAGLAAALASWRRRTAAPAAEPQIALPAPVQPRDDEPCLAPPPTPSHGPDQQPATALRPLPSPAFGQPAAPPLRIEAVPTHLTRSMMTASFACRLSIVNRGQAALENITVGLDLVTAHKSLPASEQLADPARPLPEASRIARIEPGERVEIDHEVRLPTSAIRTLRQGSAQLYVPLLRVRAQARDEPAVARTFIIGTLPTAGATRLQPFRLDEMPQTYRAIGLAALD